MHNTRCAASAQHAGLHIMMQSIVGHGWAGRRCSLLALVLMLYVFLIGGAAGVRPQLAFEENRIFGVLAEQAGGEDCQPQQVHLQATRSAHKVYVRCPCPATAPPAMHAACSPSPAMSRHVPAACTPMRPRRRHPPNPSPSQPLHPPNPFFRSTSRLRSSPPPCTYHGGQWDPGAQGASAGPAVRNVRGSTAVRRQAAVAVASAAVQSRPFIPALTCPTPAKAAL